MRLVFAAFAFSFFWRRCAGLVWLFKFIVQGFELLVALLDLLIVEVVQFQCLFENKKMLQFVVPFQRLFDLFFALGALGITITRKHFSISFTANDGTNNLHSCDARNIAQ